MAPPLSLDERKRRKGVIEALLLEGYHPQGSRGGIASATKEAERREGTNYPNWTRYEEARRDAGLDHQSVDWSLYTGVKIALEDTAPETTRSASDHALTRSTLLKEEVDQLVSASRYPLINPEAIVVDSHMVRRYDRKSGETRLVEGRPRTWVSDTLQVAPVQDARLRKYIFTSAQNDADVHPIWSNLLAYAQYLGAEIVVGPLTYETQWWSENDPTAREYAPEIRDHLCFGQMRIGDNFIFAGEMNTLPTASAPISDLTTYSRSRWAVFPHPKRQLKSVPSTDPNTQSHQVMTTGSVTRPKVIPRKAGVKSIFHHVAGAVVVEFDETGNIFCRQITGAADGSFYDLDRRVENGTVTEGHAIDALVCGDIHLRKMDPANALATFGFSTFHDAVTHRGSIVDILKPKDILLHDVFDHETRNHHHTNDPYHTYEMAYRDRDRIEDEIVDVMKFLSKLNSANERITVVESNHDIGLDRYIKEGRYRGDGINMRIGNWLEAQMIRNTERKANALDNGVSPPPFSLLHQAVRKALQDRVADAAYDLTGVRWASDGRSLLINGIEVGHHGFRGVNGAKGTVAGFTRVGRKMTIADKHSPEINEGVYVAGAMALQMGYNKGPSSWAVSHVVQYKDGSRAILTLQKGRWRAEKPRLSIKSGSLAA